MLVFRLFIFYALLEMCGWYCFALLDFLKIFFLSNEKLKWYSLTEAILIIFWCKIWWWYLWHKKKGNQDKGSIVKTIISPFFVWRLLWKYPPRRCLTYNRILKVKISWSQLYVCICSDGRKVLKNQTMSILYTAQC